MPPQEGKKKIFGAFAADTFPQNLQLEKDGFKNFGGSGGGGGGGRGDLEFEQAAPLAAHAQQAPAPVASILVQVHHQSTYM